MRNVKKLLPKSKFDTSNMETLKLLSDEEIIPICSELLEWIQDCNWPVAKDIVYILALHQEIFTPLVIELLKPEEQDDDWKFSIIVSLLPLFSPENLKPILPFLDRIAQNPTEGELISGVDEVASDLLLKFFQRN